MSSQLANPFSTKHWKPGILPYQFREGEGLDVLAQRFFQMGGVAQIVGPHGTGKTTLLESLADYFRQQGIQICRATLHDRQRRLPSEFRSIPSSEDRATILYLLDGYEQLSIPARWILRLINWRKSGLLLWTTHRPAPFVPMLHKTQASFPLFQEFVSQLTEKSPIAFENNELKKIFERSNGNFRSAFFELYDLVEECS